MTANNSILAVRPAIDQRTYLMTRQTYEALPNASTPGLRKALVDGCNYAIDPDGTFHRVKFGIYIRED